MTARLRRSSPDLPGFTRHRRGKGFTYRDEHGDALQDRDALARIAALAIPPAWSDVWICPHVNGHLQAVGTDAAGRRQYLYHEHWRRLRDAEKHRRTVELGEALPAARRRATGALRRSGLTRERVLAAAFRLLDVASFRVGSESYATENGTFGLATLRREHAVVRGQRVTFRYVAKGAQDRLQSFRDGAIARVVTELLERDDPSPELLSWFDVAWHDVRSTDINDSVRELTRGEFTAKDLRTWNATVLMAQCLAGDARPATERARERTIRDCYVRVADYLGNTPTVARTSYVDARIVDLYRDGVTVPRSVLPVRQRDLPVHGRVERAVLRLLKDMGR